MVSLKKKLESMVKLNKTLSQERATLLEKCKASVRDRWIMVIRWWWWQDNGLRKDATTSDWDLSPPYRRLRGTWGAIATSSLYFQLSFVRYLVFVKYTKYIKRNIRPTASWKHIAQFCDFIHRTSSAFPTNQMEKHTKHLLVFKFGQAQAGFYLGKSP